MTLISAELPQDRQVWLRAFYGFGPENSGYIGFTRERQRESILQRMRDGDLVLIYGAIGELTEKSLKQQALGFLEITKELCSDRERSSDVAIQWKVDHGFQDRWTFGLKVTRAWRVNNRVHIKTIAPNAYANEHRFERTTRAILLSEPERARALSHSVRQVNVYDEPEIPADKLLTGSMQELLKPSRGIAPSFGTRTSTHEDGENNLYLMVFEGGAEILLGNGSPHHGKALVKVGRSNDPKRRLREVNGGFPESGRHRWRLGHTQTFQDGATAHQHETELKALFDSQFSSLGGEFFAGDTKEIENKFTRFCAEKIPAIKGATGKAKGVR